jgi:uncharacterized membrane protein
LCACLPAGKMPSGVLSTGVFAMNPIFARALFATAVMFAAPAEAKYISFDPTGSNFTMPTFISDKGAIVGFWFDGSFYHGFVRGTGGTITSFDPTGSENTTPLGINDKGVIVGAYQDVLGNNQIAHGFIRNARGKITNFDAPGSGGYTLIRAIDDTNTFTGYYTDNLGHDHGFVQDAAGTFTSFDPQNAEDTYPWAMNEAGTITGYYYCDGQDGCGPGVSEGFIRASNGTIITFEVQTGAYPVGINASGVVTGTYTDDVFQVHGFVRAAGGEVTTFDYPGIPSGTYPEGINDDGNVVGYWFDSQNNVHGFERTAAGKFKLIQPKNPPATNSQTVGINNKGQIAGFYVVSPSDGLHGFLDTK